MRTSLLLRMGHRVVGRVVVRPTEPNSRGRGGRQRQRRDFAPREGNHVAAGRSTALIESRRNAPYTETRRYAGGFFSGLDLSTRHADPIPRCHVTLRRNVGARVSAAKRFALA